MLSGINYEYRIENILPRSPAKISGIKVKDKLISINGEWTFYNCDGSIWKVGHFLNGIEHGKFSYYG